MAGTPSAPGDEAEAVGEGATAAAASAREAKALAARVHELSRPRGAGGDHSCRSERDFTDFARAAEGWRKDREVLMSLCNLFYDVFYDSSMQFPFRDESVLSTVNRRPRRRRPSSAHGSLVRAHQPKIGLWRSEEGWRVFDDAAIFRRGRGEYTVYNLPWVSRKGLRDMLGLRRQQGRWH